jgi:three-Cys-motif partner protein
MWDRKRQTQIKHAILEDYLWAWIKILGKKRALLYYIDGFAGPGQYKEKGEIKPGSPVIAIDTYIDHREKGEQYELRFINVEKKRNSWQELEESTSKYKHRVYVKNILGEFLDNIDDILKEIGNDFGFFFIDPFGISGIEFAELERIFKREETEILLNFSYDGLQRCIGQLENVDHYDEKRRRKAVKTIERVCRMLNADEKELRQIITSSGIPKEKEISLLRKYVENLRNYKTFVYPLPINYPGRKRTFYYLIFMTQNIIALKIMKDVMKKAKEMEKVGQLFLPLPDVNVEVLKTKLYERYKGRVVELNEIYKDWLPKVYSLDGEDYLARDIDRALKLLLGEKDMPVTKISGRYFWNPYYKFGKVC